MLSTLNLLINNWEQVYTLILKTLHLKKYDNENNRYGTHCYRIGWTDPHLGPGPGQNPLSLWGRFFVRLDSTANNKTDAETETAQALFGGQRMENRELSLQITFSPDLGWDTSDIEGRG